MALHKKNAKRNPKGTKKGDKIHGKKAGKKGEAAAYMTRAQALAKLQLPLADFRRLCILKGIYPRDPKRKPHGMDKTYYHHKDILFLAHEPLLNKFFEIKTFMKKFKRLMGRKERDLASSLEQRKPTYTLHHLIRERYPAFEDAVRDLDDGVSMLALFQSLSADQRRGIPTDAVNEATRLYQEFQLYVIRAQALRKCFASIKGYYFQVEICGQPVTWLAPHQFSQDLPVEVDFRVMLTFLEFYRTTVKFTNYKLYGDLGMAYPPKRNKFHDGASGEIAAIEVEMREAGAAVAEQAAKDGEKDEAGVVADVVAEFGEQSAEALEMQRQVANASRMKTTFRGLRVFINREVPLRPMYFVLLCGGATEVGWGRGAKGEGKGKAGKGPEGDALGSAFGVENKSITHHIIDRPLDQIEKVPGREYVQPQWVLDSFNTGCLLPIAPYAPGRAPPPHLSPFVDDKAEGYVPRQREILDQYAADSTGVLAPAATEGGKAGTAKPGQSAFDKHSEELKAEKDGMWHADFKEKKAKAAAAAAEVSDDDVDVAAGLVAGPAAFKAPAYDPSRLGDPDAEEQEPAPRPTEEQEERLRAKALMPKKHKRLLQRIEKSEQKKTDSNATLVKKRKDLEKSKR